MKRGRIMIKLKAPSEWQTSGLERRSYYVYFTGQSIINSFVGSCLTTYFVLLGLDPLKVAAVMLAVKIWDAVNDAVFGVLFDRIKFKSGNKCLPWLKISLFFIPIVSIFMFAIPDSISESAQLLWFAITYLLWDTAYTLCDVPIYSVITYMTDNMDERNGMMAYKNLWGSVGGTLSPMIATFLVSERVGSNYMTAAIISAVLAFATMVPACINVKERHPATVTEESFTIKMMFTYLVKNKYLLIYYLGVFFYSSVNYVGALNLLASYYLFHDSLFTTIVGIFGTPFGLAANLLIPKLLRKYDKMMMFRICAVAVVVSGILMWLFGYKNPVYFVIFSVLRTLPTSAMGVMLFMFTPDCAEYGQYKSNIEAKGITFAIQTFVIKLSGAVSSSLSVGLLGLPIVGWVTVKADNFEQLAAMGITQTPQALDAFWFIYAMIPTLGYLAAYIAWRFYNLKDNDVQIMAQCNSGAITREEAESKLSRKY